MNLDKASLKVRTNMLFYRGESLNYYENDEIEAVKLNYKSKNNSEPASFNFLLRTFLKVL